MAELGPNGYRLCKRGHEKGPENLTKAWECKACVKIIATAMRRRKGILPKDQSRCKRGHERTPENTGREGRCKACHAEVHAEWCRRNPEKVYAWGTKWRKANKDVANATTARYRKRFPEVEKMHNAKRVASASNGYVADKLGIPLKDATPELLELKRNQILFKRELEKLKSALKGG